MWLGVFSLLEEILHNLFQLVHPIKGVIHVDHHIFYDITTLICLTSLLILKVFQFYYCKQSSNEYSFTTFGILSNFPSGQVPTSGITK